MITPVTLTIIITIAETLGIILAQVIIIAAMYIFRKPIAKMYIHSFTEFVNDPQFKAEIEKEFNAFATSMQEPNIDDEPLVI